MKSFRLWLPALVIALVFGVTGSALAQKGKGKEHVFHGKVEKVDEKAKTLTVNGESVPGWMAAMTMMYAVDNKDVVAKLKAGDEITAKVYDGDQQTLYDVQPAPPKSKK